MMSCTFPLLHFGDCPHSDILPYSLDIPLALPRPSTDIVEMPRSAKVGTAIMKEIPDSHTRICPETNMSPFDRFMKHYLHGEETKIFIRVLVSFLEVTMKPPLWILNPTLLWVGRHNYYGTIGTSFMPNQLFLGTFLALLSSGKNRSTMSSSLLLPPAPVIRKHNPLLLFCPQLTPPSMTISLMPRPLRSI